MQRFTSWLLRLRKVANCVLLTAFLAHPSAAQDLGSPRIAEARDKHCAMEVRGEGSAFLISVSGLVPNERLEITSESEGEILQYPAQANQRGEYDFIEVPLVVGKHSGVARITVASVRCRLKVSFPWRE